MQVNEAFVCKTDDCCMQCNLFELRVKVYVSEGRARVECAQARIRHWHDTKVTLGYYTNCTIVHKQPYRTQQAFVLRAHGTPA